MRSATFKAVFSKKDAFVFISHLDLMRLFQRAVRRADLPISFTKGFNPHPRISIVRALKLGVESDALDAVFHLDSQVEPEEFKAALNDELPYGIRIREVAKI